MAVGAGVARLAPVAIGGAALALRLIGLGDKPYWLDEALTLHRARLPLPELVADSIEHLHSPAYFLLVRPIALVTDAEWALRLPSALAGTLAAVLVYAVGRAAWDGRAGIAAGLLMALSPFQVQYAQEARSYAISLALVLAALWGLLRLANDPAAAAAALTRPGPARGPWAAYAAGSAGALLLHAAGVLWLIAGSLILLAIVAGAGSHRRAVLKNGVVVTAVVLAVWLPLLTLLARWMYWTAVKGYWVPPPSAEWIGNAIEAVYLGRISDVVMFAPGPAALPGLGLALAALAAFGAWRLRRRPLMLAALAAALLVLPAALLIASLVRPVFLPRYLLWSAPPFFVLAGLGIAALPARAFAAALAALTAAGLWNLAPYYGFEAKPRWDLAARHIAERLGPDDAVLLTAPSMRLVFEPYYRRFGGAGGTLAAVATIEAARAVQTRGGAVWGIRGRVGYGSELSAEAFGQATAPLGPPAEAAAFGRHVTVYRFPPAGD